MARPVFGTAHLYSLVPVDEVEPLLAAALDAGFRDVDTAPSYGFGEAEQVVGRALRGRADVQLTTKVGIAASPRAGRATRFVKAAARRLPDALQDRIRGERPAGGGAFGIDEVRASVERSLANLPRIDRLLLHEVTPADITDELLATLTRYVDRGDVGRVGVATSPSLTTPSLDRAPLLQSANVSIAPPYLAGLPAGIEVVGHGPLGAGAATLRTIRGRIAEDAEWAGRWAVAVSRASLPPCVRSGGEVDTADVLLAYAAGRPELDGVVVATSRPGRLAHLVELVAAVEQPLDTELAELIDAAAVTPR